MSTPTNRGKQEPTVKWNHRPARRLKIYKIGGEKYNITHDFKLYRVTGKGTKRIKGMERIAILRALFPTPAPQPKKGVVSEVVGQ